jgi:hypothetical protein
MELATDEGKATNGLRIAEVLATVARGRLAPPHLRSWRDGFGTRASCRSQPALAVPSPGVALSAAGRDDGARCPWRHNAGTPDIHRRTMRRSPSWWASFDAVLVFTKVYGVREGIVPPDPLFNAILRFVTLVAGLTVGGTLLLLGPALGVCARRVGSEFGAGAERAMRLGSSAHGDPVGFPHCVCGVLPEQCWIRSSRSNVGSAQ